MTKDEVLKMAIEAMSCISQSRGDPLLKAINACKEALEQPAQEPVAWVWVMEHEGAYRIFATEEQANEFMCGYAPAVSGDVIVIRRKVYGYTHPYQWQGLSDDDIQEELKKMWDKGLIPSYSIVAFARAIEQALKEKNGK